MAELELDALTTAVVVIDLQRSVMKMPGLPHSVESVVKKTAELAGRFRVKGAVIVYVRVDLANFLRVTVDQPFRDPNAPPPPAEMMELAPEAGWQGGDLLITKRSWDAFAGTDLEQRLRSRNTRTIVLCGVATNFGVESTARTAAAFGFDVVIVEDAMTSISAEAHRFAITQIFPRLGRVRTADELHPK